MKSISRNILPSVPKSNQFDHHLPLPIISFVYTSLLLFFIIHFCNFDTKKPSTVIYIMSNSYISYKHEHGKIITLLTIHSCGGGIWVDVLPIKHETHWSKVAQYRMNSFPPQKKTMISIHYTNENIKQHANFIPLSYSLAVASTPFRAAYVANTFFIFVVFLILNIVSSPF